MVCRIGGNCIKDDCQFVLAQLSEHLLLLLHVLTVLVECVLLLIASLAAGLDCLVLLFIQLTVNSHLRR